MSPKFNNMEDILAQLLVPDNETIGEATKTLNELFKSSEAIPLLCNVLSTSSSAQIRQYAAVLLRKRLAKSKNWNKLTPETQNMVKTGILPVLISETEKAVKTSVVQFIGVVAKHEVKKGSWTELLSMLQSLITSQTQSDVELAMFSMSVLTDVALDVFADNPSQFVYLFNSSFHFLDDLTSKLGYYTIITMTHVVSHYDTSPELKEIYAKAIPKIISSFPALLAADEVKAYDVLDLFSEILTGAIPLLTPHMSIFIQFCLHIIANKEVGASVRDRAMMLIGAAVRVKKKLIIKLNLVKPIVGVLFNVMCEPPEDEEAEDEEDWFTEEDNEAPFQSATNILGVLALYLPPNKLLETLLEHVSGSMTSPNRFVKKAGFLALAIVTEGASECVRNNYLKMFLECVRAGITDNSSTVRNAALFALGQLAEHLQPEISEHSDDIMPILFEYLSQLCQRLSKGSPDPPGLYSMFYALESFCENLEEKLVPYLPMLMEKLLSTLQRQHSINVQELALSAVGSVASAVKADILPYFPTIIEKLKIYLLEEPTEETSCLQVQAIQTLSLIVRTMGPEHFVPLASETSSLGLNLLGTCEDPDLRSALYSLFAAMSFVLKNESAFFIPILTTNIFKSLKSTEGVVTHDNDLDEPYSVYDDLSDTQAEEDIGSESSDEPEEITVENPYMEEKEEACLALKEFALNAETAFLPYLEESFKEVYELINFPHDDVRKSSFEAVAQFCVNFSKIETAEGKQALLNALTLFTPQCTDTALKDEECTVANAAVEALATMLREIGPPFLELTGARQVILTLVSDILLNKAICQGRQEDEEVDEEDGSEAEQDELLMETAGEVIPAFGKAVSSADFIVCLQSLLPAILPKLSKNVSVSQRSFFIGTLAECMKPAGPELEKRQDLTLQLLNLYLPMTQDTNFEVRNNAIFGLGELVLHSKQSLFPKYLDLLQALSALLAQESVGIAVDNICGALAKMIRTNVELIPMGEVFPVLLEKLPLKEDFDEHEAVLECFGHLYQLGHPSLKTHISTVIQISCSILHEKKGNDEILSRTVMFLKFCIKDFPTEFTAVLQSLTVEAASSMAPVLS